MIKGKLFGVEFVENGRGISCKDPDIKEKIKTIYKLTVSGKGPADGFPEYYFLEDLKKWGKDFELIEFKEPEIDPNVVY